jgi:glucan phosphoethanolaminetransferase (alkaline phosphatase superfamily)
MSKSTGLSKYIHMWLALLAAIVILAFALLIRQFEESSREFKKPFLIILAIFFILYIGATIFISYNISVYSAEVGTAEKSGDGIKIINDDFEPVDMRTLP